MFRLVRTKGPLPPDAIYWDPKQRPFESKLFENFDTLIHLAGANIAEKRWTKERKQELFDSRCRDARLLSELLSKLSQPPKLILSASATGYYGNRGKEILTEDSPPGEGFLSELCVAWEHSWEAMRALGTRVVYTRFGIVLSPKGGFLKKMLPLFRWGIGGELGSGKQLMSWISLEDLLGAFAHILNTPSLEGPVNCTTAFPVSQAEFTKRLAKHLHRPAFFHLPRWLILFVWGEMGEEMLLSGSAVLPKRLLNSGFSFQTPHLEDALKQLD